MDGYCFPVTVEGNWSTSASKTIKNKLQIYFQSKNKSSGGDCIVNYEDPSSTRATVYFISERVRENVLLRDDHEISVKNEIVKLRVSSSSKKNPEEASSPSVGATSNELSDVSDRTPDDPLNESSPGDESTDKRSPQSSSVVLERVPEDVSREMLILLVESIPYFQENSFTLEVIGETNTAVLTFNNPNDVDRFLTGSKNNKNFQKHGLIGRVLERSHSVRVEKLSSTVNQDILDLYFEKFGGPVKSITMIPDEQAAVVTFQAAEAVETVLKKEHQICRVSVNVYPFYKSLGTALYGKDRAKWKMPDPFTMNMHPSIWKFVSWKKQLSSISNQMEAHFCHVDMDSPDVKLSPMPTLLRQKGVTRKHVDEWKQNASNAFRDIMAQYAVFECDANAPVWKVVENNVRALLRDDALLAMDASKGALTVTGLAKDTNRLRKEVEDVVQRATSQLKRQRDGVSKEMDLSPSMFYILQQTGLQQHAAHEAPEMDLSYSDDTKKLVLSGLESEVYKVQNWILQRTLSMSKKVLKLDPNILEFLRSVDRVEMSRDLFSSRGIGAEYSVEGWEVLLTGSSDTALAEAEKRVNTALSLRSIVVEDPEVLKIPEWKDLNSKLVDAYNSTKKRTVMIKHFPEDRNRIIVSGFRDPVEEIGKNLEDFVDKFSAVQDSVHVKSCAVVKFIQEKKLHEWKQFVKVNVHFKPGKTKIILSGARLHVNTAKASFQKMAAALCTDELAIMKPGARKYFKELGRMYLSMTFKEYGCLVLLQEDYMLEEDEDEDENEDEEIGFGCPPCCEVRTPDGILVSVSQADICKFKADAVVNASNEDLAHIGGLALALLKAAGPRLQELSNQYVRQNGKLKPGDAVVTDGCNLPCKYVVHAVGPRFSDFDRRESIQRLKQAVNKSLMEAAKFSCQTVAVPAVSSGIFGFPLDLCTETIAKAVRDYCESQKGASSLTEIHLVDNNDKTVRAFAIAVQNEFKHLHPKMAVPLQSAHFRRGTKGEGGYGYKQPPQGQRQQGHGGGREGGRGKGGREGGGKTGWRGGYGGGRGRRGGWRQSETQGNDHENREETNRKFEEAGRGEIIQTYSTPEGLKIILRKGNIQEECSDIIVNTISGDLDLRNGAVSQAILKAAGPQIQTAARKKAHKVRLDYGDGVVTDGYNLACQKVIHTVCPCWDRGTGTASEVLKMIIRNCLIEAETLCLASMSFPAIGTGNMGFPRDLVSNLIQEIKEFSQKRSTAHLKEVAIVVHHSDGQSVECFDREFKGQTQAAGQSQHPKPYVVQSQHPKPYVVQSQQSSGFFGQVLSPSLGVHIMQMGHVTFEVSSGDITREKSDVIVNSSNSDFTLKTGVSKAILEGAGLAVELECAKLAKSQSDKMIMTSAGSLPCRKIIHVVGQNKPEKVKETVYGVLKMCEERKVFSVSFPALGTGQGGASPAAVADAMIDAVVDFVRKKGQFVKNVKILIFQPAMVAEFHKSMMKRVGQEVEEKGFFTKIKESVTSLFMGPNEELDPSRSAGENFVLEGEEIEPTVFQLCAETPQAVTQARAWIQSLIVKEQTERTIRDPYINHLSQEDIEKLQAMQRELTIRIRLEKKGPDSLIHLEGLSRDVLTADGRIRDMVRAVERAETRRREAFLVSSLVEWQYQNRTSTMVAFDLFTNLDLEVAFGKKLKVKIKIDSDDYEADVINRKASRIVDKRQIELLRKDLKGDASLPKHWDDMKGLLELVSLSPTSVEYQEVEKECVKTGLNITIVEIARVQNETLWKNYQIKKKHLEEKNKHTNNEKLLFHGTSSTSIAQINNSGFNRSYAGTHGAAIGNGTYFAVDPGYSANGYATPDAQGDKRMYLARVLVGDFTQGQAHLVVPPAKSSGNPADLYDSVTDNPSNPTIFVVFNDVQAYPEYLITFK